MNTANVVSRIVVIALVLVAAASGRAAAGQGPKARMFAKYDTNKNGVIDGEEVAAVRAAYAADPKGEFARYDTDKDGKLSDAEIAQIKPPGGGKGGAGAGKHTRKAAGDKQPESQPAGE